MWINDAQREVVNVLPSAYTITSTPTLQAGTRQTLSGLGLTAAITVADVVRNFSAAGVAGRAITLRKREWFDEHLPNWHAEIAAEAEHWMADPRDPKAFYLYPKVVAGKVEIVCPTTPAELTTINSLLTLDDVYANAVQWFLLFSFNSKDATFSTASQKAGAYYQLFLQSLGVKATATMQNTMAAKASSSAGAKA